MEEKYPGQIKVLEIDLEGAKKLVEQQKYNLNAALEFITEYQKKIGYLETMLSFLKTGKTGD